MEGWISPRLTPRLPFQGPPRSLTGDEADLRDLIAACREGRFSDVTAWIEAGRPVQVEYARGARRPRTTALAVAIDTGQHDLVLLLLAAGYRPDLEPCSPFDRVLRDRRWDLVDLLLDAGADPRTVDPDAVFGTYSREVMERFWSLGVDLAGDGALAEALATATRNRPLYGFVKNHTGDPRIQREADLALGYAIGRKNEKAVSFCLWAGANPRHSVPTIGDGDVYSDDWTMTAFERAVWEGVPNYLGKLGFDLTHDAIEDLYEVAYRVSDIEALVRIRPPKDWHPIADRFLDRVTFPLDLGAGRNWGTTWELERIFQLGGRLRELSDLAKLRLRRHLRDLSRDEARRLLRLLGKYADSEAFLDLIAHPMFIGDYKDWGLKKTWIEHIAEGLGGSKNASAKARRVLKAEKALPPTIKTPYNKASYVRVTRAELHKLVWSTPMVRASSRYGLSDNGLRKVCKKLGVPTPPRGYWAKGSRQNRPPRLPTARIGWPVEAWLPKPPARQQ